MPPSESTPKQDDHSQVIDKLKDANNVLVTVSSNPSLDQLSACIGLTLALNKMEKHGTAVFSGKIPSALGFLKPEETLEKNTDSLRDFIISLDKSKADKLRYKVEDDVVKIFITPYRTSISEKDFDFSQGDFNVDAVVALGVTKKTDLDNAITSHGRILHDATVISVNTSKSSQDQLGAIRWDSEEASSLCEMVSDLISEIGDSTLDNQISTALLTGIVVETQRFSNDKSKPHTMQVAGKLMEAGASTQLITTKLETKASPAKAEPQDEEDSNGLLEIEHKDEDKPKDKTKDEIPSVVPADQQPPTPEPPSQPEEESLAKKPEENNNKEEKSSKIKDVKTDKTEEHTSVSDGPSYVSEPPRMGGRWTANDRPEDEQYSQTDPLSQSDPEPTTMVSSSETDNKDSSANEGPQDDSSASKKDQQDDEVEVNNKTLHDIETSVKSPHLDQGQQDNTNEQPDQESEEAGAPQSDSDNKPEDDGKKEDKAAPSPNVDYARDAVERASTSYDPDRPEPVQALNAQELNADNNGDDSKGDSANESDEGDDKKDGKSSDSSPPPPVPPPMTPPSQT